MSILLSPCCVLGTGLGLTVETSEPSEEEPSQVVLLCQETGSQGIRPVTQPATG